MNTYKTAKIAEAVKALMDYHNAATQRLAELDKAKQRYSPEVYRDKETEATTAFFPFYTAAKEAIDEAVKELNQRAEQARNDYLSIGDASADYQLLSLPVTLTPDDLRTLVKRNEGNALFARAVGLYAKEHGYNEHKDLAALVDARGPYDMHIANANNVRDILCKCLASDNLAGMRGNFNGELLARIDAEGILSEV